MTDNVIKNSKTLPNRLKYVKNGERFDKRYSKNNGNILTAIPIPTEYNPEGKSASQFTKKEIINKFINYAEVKDLSTATHSGSWCRVLKKVDNQWEYRAGGFFIHNNPIDKYIVLVNREHNFTFSFQYDEIRLFTSLGKNKLVFTKKNNWIYRQVL